MKNIRSIWANLAGLMLLIGVAAMNAPEADAAGCPRKGKLWKSFPLDFQGIRLGTLDIFSHRANGGTKTACLHHHSATWGTKLPTSVFIGKCRYNDDCLDVQDGGRQDTGTYGYYAGPVTVTRSRGKCITVYGYIGNPYDNRKGISQLHVHAQFLGCRTRPIVDYYPS